MKKIVILYNCLAIIYLVVLLVYISLYGISRLYIIRLIGDDDIYVNVNSKYFDSGYVATFLNKNVKDIDVYNNVDTNKIGHYYVFYNKRFIYFNNWKKRNVYVIDKEKPSISLKGSDYVYLNLNDDYIEEGVEAVDNVDGDITKNIKIESTIDNQVPGKYIVKYIIEDSSGNKNETERNVEVINSNLLTSSIADFRLKNSFKDVILEYEDKEYDYLNDAVFLGDCNTLFLYQKGNYLSKTQVWGKYNLNIAEMNYSTFTTFSNNENVTFDTAMQNFNPKYLIVNLGLNTANYMSQSDMIQQLDYFIEHIKEKFPNTKLIMSSIVPVREYGTANGIYSMTRINHYNYFIVQECHKYGIKFINYTDEIKNNLGFGDNDYLYCSEENDCGFHLSDNGKIKYIDYLKHLNFER